MSTKTLIFSLFILVNNIQNSGLLLAQDSENAATTATQATSSEETQVRLREMTVTERRPSTAASSETIRARDFELRPHSTTQEILNNIPGLVAGQHAGGGKAMQYFLRGFDNDHGTDIALFVDGVPVNMVSHAHGQGYADLNFLIPETVERVELYKGPYFVQWGDLANSGAVNFITKEDTVENSLQALGGFFNTMRYTGVVSPRLGPVQTLLAGEVYFSDGPFRNPENYARYNFFGKFTLTPHPDAKLSLWFSAHDGDWDASGQIPLREVHARRLARFGAIDPSEGGRSDQQNVNLVYTFTPSPQENWLVQLYGSRYKLTLFSNFTFFLRDSVRGDGINQDDSRVLYGGRVRYNRLWELGALPTQSTIGFETRNDDADVGLFRQQKRQRFATVNKVNVEERSFSGYLQQEFFLREWVRLQLGVRGDFFLFDVGSRLPRNAPDAIRIRGYTNAGIVNPKASLIFSPFYDSPGLWRNTDFFLNFGMGYHSNDARDAVQANGKPLVRSAGGELGARTNLWEKLDLAAALWILDLDSELVFVGDEGATEASGPTRRWGVDVEARYAILPWLLADVDASYADPRFRVTGKAIPLAPTLLMNGGLTAFFTDSFSGALRARYLDDRPANEDRSLTARGYLLLDVILRYRWRNIEASLQVLNVADVDWRQTQFATNSCVRREVGVDPRCPTNGAGEGVEDINFVPGYPLTLRGGLTLFF
ncbi:MAG TPA: TonB-dependent receptor plug domain-containing protein [Methylomirabilota bacterium]|nr:TonB-dependent receptor plug domain-containing protein [Methylomirabilota bacterium]